MNNAVKLIANATEGEIEEIMKALLDRYKELYPEWELSLVSLEKRRGRIEQLDEMIAALEKMKGGV